MKNVGIVIVSHSPLVAEGAADMVRQMVGDEVPVAHCGGNGAGGLGTSVEAILAAIDSLRDKNLVYLYYGSTSRTVKYKHMMQQVYELEPPTLAIITLLLLRGPQTAGELRGRSDRLHEFSSIAEVQESLDELASRPEPLVQKLSRQPGQKESRYAHLLSGPVDEAALAAEMQAPAQTSSGSRIDELESRVAELSRGLDEFREEFARFKEQFE